MSRIWTDAQREAIEARGSTLLVSAAAGSGKTAVLAERILSLIQNGAQVNDLLVVTFTKAAAAEMRARILDSLQDAANGNRHLERQAMHVERADITTLHSFCGKVCREHFQAADVDPSFRIADTAETAILRERAMREALTICFSQATPAFSTIAGWLSQDELIEAVGTLHSFLMARPDPWEWLDDAIAQHAQPQEALRDGPWMRTMLDRIALQARLAVSRYRMLVDAAERTGLYVDFAREESSYAIEFLRAAEDGYDALMAFGVPTFKRRPSKPKGADATELEWVVTLRDDAKDLLTCAGKTMRQIQNFDGMAADAPEIGGALVGLAEAVRAFDERFTALKTERNLLDFNDMEHRALRALREDAVCEAMRARYAHVFVDEYQDSSLLQEAILLRVSRADNLFMVGDVKQSIYRFRLAEPTLFLHKLRTFSPATAALDRRITLSANFRSTPVILNAVNDVFDGVFCGGPMELTYEEEARLRPGREMEGGVPVELHLIDDSDDGDDESGDDDADTAADLSPAAREGIRQEAEIIADRIEAMRTAAGGGLALREMAVLMRTVRGKAAQVVQVLRQRGIPAWSDLGEDALTRPEVQAIVAILQVVDNLRQDIPLMAALRGPTMGLDDESLAAIRIATPQGPFAEAVLAYARDRDDLLAAALRGFIERVRGWALDAQVSSLDCLLRQIYDETGHYAQSGARPDGDIRQGNLRMLAEHAGVFQRAQGGGLGGFLRYLQRVGAQDGLAAQEIGERDDIVRVLSIHKSKGLQYPAVFVAGLGRRLRRHGGKGILHAHAELGLGMPHIDPILRTKHASLAQFAIQERRAREDMAEEARVLYVAMTRAERRLILVGAPRAGDEARWQLPVEPATVSGAASMLDWIVPAARGDGWTILRHRPREIATAVAAQLDATRMAERVRALPEPPQDSPVAVALSWEAPQAERAPLKRSVSAVVRAGQKRGEDADEPSPMETVSRRPLFMEARGLTAAERGDAVHAFLSALPLDAQDLAVARRTMMERGLLSLEQADSLPMTKLSRCVEGPIWARMRASNEIHREWPFNLRLEQDGRRTLLQGVIDCCFLEGDAWVLVDYKTDRADDPQQLIERYRRQLELYAHALATITGTPVAEKILFLIDREKGYEVT